jgi:hypothetical protein
MIHPALVNPFFELGDMPSSGAADALDAATWPSAANQSERYVEATAGYPCCYNCGHREPCDEHCPNARTIEGELLDGLREIVQGFEIEPVPEFIRRAG